MFAYCRNNPVCRKDIAGATDADIYMDNGEIFDDKDLYDRGGGGTSWDIFLRCIDSAADGLNMAMGNRSYSKPERHHIVPHNNKKFTPQYEEIVDRYEFSLEDDVNIVELRDHRGRHTNAYHEFIITSLKGLDRYAGGNNDKFYEGFEYIVDYILKRPWLPYAHK